MTSKLFLSTRRGEDKLYAWIRDHERGEPYRQRFESMWLEYCPHAPKGFRNKLQIEFHQRWWEMYLTIGLLHLALPVTCSPADGGPDVSVDLDNQRVWFEAVAPRAGTSNDRVPELVIKDTEDFPRRQLLLRLAQAITSKRDKFVAYLDSQTVSPRDACVIALSACDLKQFGPLLDWPHPAPLSILAGAGNLAIPLDRSCSPYSTRQDAILRNSGNPVDTVLFERDDFRIISAVLYSSPDPTNAPISPEATFSLFLNPRAYVEVPPGIRRMVVTWYEEKKTDTETVWMKI